MGYIQGDDRRQQFLLPPSIDEYVGRVQSGPRAGLHLSTV